MSIERDCLERDMGRCFICGTVVLTGPRSCHHRKLRSAGGSDTMENRITLCGSGTTGCHGQVHRQVRAARHPDAGWIVSRYADPADIPVRHWQYGMVWLTPDGALVTEEERDAWEEEKNR